MIASAFGVAACDRVFGLVRGDAAGQVTGRYERVSMANDAGGRSQVVVAPYGVGEVSATVDGPDGEPVAVDLEPDGSFVFSTAVAGQAYTLRLVAPDAEFRYQLDSEQLDLARYTGSRADRVAPPPATRLAWTLTNRQRGAFEEVVVTGLGTRVSLSAADIDLDWTQYGGLIDRGRGDRLFYTNYGVAGTGPTAYNLLDRVATADLTMAGGAANTVSSTVAAVPADQCAKVAAAAGAELDRLTAIAPGNPLVSAGWAVMATPGPELDLSTGIPLAIQAANANVVDRMQPVSFANPFPGTHLIVELSAVRGRYLSGNPGPAQTFVLTRLAVPLAVDPTCQTITALPAAQVAIPTTISIEGQSLATDDQVVVIERPSVVRVDAGLTADGNADYFVFRLFELAGNALSLRASVYALAPTVTFESSLFQALHRYVLVAESRTGFPNVASGDFRTFSATRGLAQGSSPAFLVR